MHELHDALRRIHALESANHDLRRRARRLTALSLTAALAAFAPLAMSFGPSPAPPQDALRGRSLELVDASGAVYASLQQDGQGHPMLLLRKDQAHAALTTNGPALHLRAEDGRRGLFAGFDTQGVGKFELADASLTARAALRMQADGMPGVHLHDAQGYERVGLVHLADDSSLLRLKGARDAVRAIVGLDAAGNASTLLLDAQGRRRAGMLVQSDGTPLLSLEDEKTRPRVHLTMDFDGAPTLRFLGPDGRPSHTYP